MPFKFERTKHPDLLLICSTVFSDERGYFSEMYKMSEFRRNGIDYRFVQDSQSVSRKGVLRGLHFQREPMAQGKLVSVSMGAMFDVAVDIRKGSPFFGMWYGTVLSEENRLMLWVPPGFAHGFMSLDDCLVMNYKFTNEYSSEHEGGIIWNDPQIAIDWPLVDPILSEKDSMLPRLSEIDSPFVYQPA